MQFGKVHGVGFIVLGLLLLGAQAFIVMRGQNSHNVPNSPRVEANEPHLPEKKISRLPVIIGSAAVVAGIALLVSNRNKPQE
jgi:hypothetical protein